MKTLAITVRAAREILNHSNRLRAFADLLADWIERPWLRSSNGTAWGLRLGTNRQDQSHFALWHPDYLSGTGSEDWAILLLTGELGILEEPEMREVGLERALYIAEKRLSGMLIDNAFINKTIAPNIRRCVVGRGGTTQQKSIVYWEDSTSGDLAQTRTVILSGATDEEAEPTRLLQSLIPKAPAFRAASDALAYNLLRPTTELNPPTETLFQPRAATPYEVPVTRLEVGEARIPTANDGLNDDLSYENWIETGSSLTQQQRRILDSRHLSSQPIRIVGAAGTGKTLLMTLLVGRVLTEAEQLNAASAVLYVTHNSAMREHVFLRMISLGYERFLDPNSKQKLNVATLSDHAREQLSLSDTQIIDRDASETKSYQVECVRDALKVVSKRNDPAHRASSFLTNPELVERLVPLLPLEIGLAIKGHGLQNDGHGYIDSERPLSKLHSVLAREDRQFLFAVFEEYHRRVFMEDNLLDADDVALSLLGRLRTPLWQMQRKTLGADFLFVDEAQLFNDNERRIFPLLTRGATSHIPVVLALDEAQDLSGSFQAGLGTLGYESIHNETLISTHRCTPAIIQLAMHVLQRTTDLFSSSYPNLASGQSLVPSAHPQADSPRFHDQPESLTYAEFVSTLVIGLRKQDVRTIAVAFHVDRDRAAITDILKERGQNVRVIRQRGERPQRNGPAVVTGRPEDLGGQEFDAVVCVGLEQGVTPATVQTNQALDSALEQRALREMYLAFTRARYRLLVPVSKGRRLTPVLQNAVEAGLLRPPSK